MSTNQRPSSADSLSRLDSGALEIEGRVPWSSNATFVARVLDANGEILAIYKPLSGEEPLWDFPRGLYRREVAAYLLDQFLGWDLVPETVVRHDAPFGVGSLQRIVQITNELHYLNLRSDARYDEALRTMATFDLLANNADRKSGHCLVDDVGHVWGIDHGLCFHAEPKLRTVMWDYAGQGIPTHLLPGIIRVAEVSEVANLNPYLDEAERTALRLRAQSILNEPVFPAPTSRRDYPWPFV